ncbi:MAG: hypothetical protein QOC94_3818 [Actinoplanes sp.]|nr:hypothetical protein [Actinoplanes sp.]
MKRRLPVLMSTFALMAAMLVAAGPVATAAEPDIKDQLEAIPGMTVVSDQPLGSYRFFILSFTQPTDHRHPEAGTFEQRLTLLHRDTARPMVLHTTGYGVPTFPFRSEPTQLIDGNQISVEQRFFTPSRPEPADWDKLTIWQAATDHHRIVQALKTLYRGKWISTGESKGGMTSVYHRRFYPSDVDGTVVYAAPDDAVNAEDSAYDRFFANVGTDPACRTALDGVQIEALERRDAMVAKYSAWATANNRTFTTIGSADKAFELMVNGAPWAFWQYSLQSFCVNVPARDAPDDAIYNWITGVYGVDSLTDQGLDYYVPYYFQAAKQLGWPTVELNHLATLQHYRGQDDAAANVPDAIDPRFQPLAMADIDRWVKLHGSQLLFVYGSDDPYGAEPFRLGRGTIDSLSYVAPGANHGADIAALTADEAATATAAVQRWAGVATNATLRAAPSYIPSLDDRNLALDRRYSR